MTVTPSQSDSWRRMWDLFQSALEKEGSERDAFLEEACAGDDALKQQVESLLGTHDETEGLLDRPIAPTLPRNGPESSRRAASSTQDWGEANGTARFLGELFPGRVLEERFEIIGLVGRGGMGAVYKAWDRHVDATVAVKVLRPEIASDDTEERFRREIHLARQVTHPNVCRLYDLFHDDDELSFLSMELLDGETLAQRQQREGALESDEALLIVMQIAAALSAAHRVGIVHRDLKSANIMLVPDEEGIRAVVTDFGLAKTSRPDEESLLHLTRTGQVLGTPAFMAPEQLEGGEVTPATDIYAFGVVMYEMLTGKLPFDGTTPYSIAAHRLHDEAPSPRFHLPELDRRWERTILRCLEREPGDRFATVEEITSSLESGTVSLPRSQRLRRYRKIAWATFAIFLTLAALWAWSRVSWLVQTSQRAEIARGETELARVTTSSLRALELYSEADTAISAQKNPVAEELLRQAIAEDPDFASGYIHLAHAIRNQGRPREEFLPYAQQAADRVEATTDPERFFILGSYYDMSGEDEKAIRNYETLLRLQPDHSWALGNLDAILFRLGRGEELIPYWVKAAELRPNEFETNASTGWMLAAIGGRLDEAEPYVRHALELATTEELRQDPGSASWLWIFPMHQAWVEGDLELSLAELERLANQVPEMSGPLGTQLAWVVGVNYEYLGQQEAAEQIYLNMAASEISEGNWRRRSMRNIALERRTVDQWEEILRGNIIPSEGEMEVFFLVRAGILVEARELLSSFEEPSRQMVFDRAQRRWAEGELALAEGEIKQAIPLLQEAVAGLRHYALAAPFFWASEALARALEAEGNVETALAVLEDASQQRPRAFQGKGGWMDMRVTLAKMHHKYGREPQARAIEAELRGLLRHADPDFRVLRELERLEQTTEP